MNNFLNYVSTVWSPAAYTVFNYLSTQYVPTAVLVCWAAAALTAAIALYKTAIGQAITIKKLREWKERVAQAEAAAR